MGTIAQNVITAVDRAEADGRTATAYDHDAIAWMSIGHSVYDQSRAAGRTRLEASLSFGRAVDHLNT